MRFVHRAAAVVIAALASFSASASEGLAPPEPDGVWSGPLLGDTPATLRGAAVLDLAGLEALMAETPLLVDSGPADRKPDHFPEGALWKPTHRSIPGAHWFPGAGLGELDRARVDALLAGVAALAGGDKTKPVVTYCQPRCWGSWNVGKRLVEAGYARVYWFPGGVTAWQKAHDTAPVEPEPGWAPGR